MGSSVSIVLPCHNEESAIPSLIQKILEVRSQLLSQKIAESVEILVVDDGSTDNSRLLLAKFPEVKCIHLITNQGYGAALKKGFEASSGEYICFLDMDETYPPSKIFEMLTEAKGKSYHMLTGTRQISDDGMSLLRGAGNLFFTYLTRWLLGVKCSDVCSGFRVIHKSLVPNILELQNNSLSFSLEMTLKFSRHPFRAGELRIPYYPRAGDSKLSVIFDGGRFLKLILGHSVKNRLFTNPSQAVPKSDINPQ